MINIACGRRAVRLASLPATAFALWLLPAASWAYTEEQQQACMGDAFRLCSAEIPDVDRVRACMVRQQSELSPGCRVYFRPQPMEPAAAARPVSVKQAHARKPHKPIKNARRDDN